MKNKEYSIINIEYLCAYNSVDREQIYKLLICKKILNIE